MFSKEKRDKQILGLFLRWWNYQLPQQYIIIHHQSISHVFKNVCYCLCHKEVSEKHFYGNNKDVKVCKFVCLFVFNAVLRTEDEPKLQFRPRNAFAKIFSAKKRKLSFWI
jgi:hypothetical protein